MQKEIELTLDQERMIQSFKESLNERGMDLEQVSGRIVITEKGKRIAEWSLDDIDEMINSIK